jgi:ADP-ribose pyrophosphatase YjhB (NUDIX family)
LDESIFDAAIREVAEETNLSAQLISLIGVYTATENDNYFVRFAFKGQIDSGKLKPGKDQLAVVWKPINELLRLPDSELVGAPMLRIILKDVLKEKSYPINLIHDLK